ncbi:MAG TPA: HAD-IC family P-type ATPase, partial [Candidatus Dormibacteraeota bacterium]|nr:HAD-IC family P-type ATPase [Candidatus Dormibacteraeota bacterium]
MSSTAMAQVPAAMQATTGIQGLTQAEATRRSKAGDGNKARVRAGRSYLTILLQATFVPVNVVLFAVTIALVVLGLGIDAALTCLPVLANVLVSAAMEASAKWRLDRLRILSTPRAKVVRDGAERSIDPSDLVRGDVVVLGRGDQVVLDGEVLDGELEVDESLLTGEADPMVRRTGDKLLSGSVCVSGRAHMQVTRVGLESYANQLTAEAQSVRSQRTPLQQGVDRLIAMASVLVVLVSLVVASSAAIRQGTVAEVVQAAAVLVALVPQGLAIMITVTYALGALRISRAGALVQRINAVESMSRVDTLILDKTGTITAPGFTIRELMPIGVDEASLRRLVSEITAVTPQGDRVNDALRRWQTGAEAATAEATETPPPTSAEPDVVPFSSARRWSG